MVPGIGFVFYRCTMSKAMIEGTKIDGPDDFEVDGYFFRTLMMNQPYIFQSKQRDPGITMA